MKQRLAGPILIFLFIAFLSVAVILFGRGYRLDFKKKTLTGTGLLAATSDPQGASIFVNGRLTSATNETLNLEPDWYDVRIEKEGYIPWQKKMEIKKEIVAETNATLFRSNPSLSPLTSTAAKSPRLSPDNTKIAYVVPLQTTEQPNLPAGRQVNLTTEKYGVFILDLNNHPLSFSRKPQLIFDRKISPQEEVSLLWSPSSAQILLLEENTAFLLDLGKKNESPPNLIGTLPTLFSNWERERKELERRKMLSLPEPLIEVFSQSADILNWSPDETKILYQATASAKISQIIKPPLSATNPTQESREIEAEKIYVYDRKEDRNYKIEIEKILPEAQAIDPSASGRDQPLAGENEKLQWLPTSKHLILTEDDGISIIEYDGTNKATIYASPFEESFVAPFPDGSKLAILTTLNLTTSSLSNLYGLSLR